MILYKDNTTTNEQTNKQNIDRKGRMEARRSSLLQHRKTASIQYKILDYIIEKVLQFKRLNLYIEVFNIDLK